DLVPGGEVVVPATAAGASGARAVAVPHASAQDRHQERAGVLLLHHAAAGVVDPSRLCYHRCHRYHRCRGRERERVSRRRRQRRRRRRQGGGRLRLRGLAHAHPGLAPGHGGRKAARSTAGSGDRAQALAPEARERLLPQEELRKRDGQGSQRVGGGLHPRRDRLPRRNPGCGGEAPLQDGREGHGAHGRHLHQGCRGLVAGAGAEDLRTPRDSGARRDPWHGEDLQPRVPADGGQVQAPALARLLRPASGRQRYQPSARIRPGRDPPRRGLRRPPRKGVGGCLGGAAGGGAGGTRGQEKVEGAWYSQPCMLMP
ncbi:unnamed protein product, partial [Ectocarpus fasciculatus]